MFLIFEIAIVFLDKGMIILAAISIRAFLILLDIWTHLAFFIVKFPLPVFGVVVVHAMLVIVVFGDVAGVYFEEWKVEMLYKV